MKGIEEAELGLLKEKKKQEEEVFDLCHFRLYTIGMV